MTQRKCVSFQAPFNRYQKTCAEMLNTIAENENHFQLSSFLYLLFERLRVNVNNNNNLVVTRGYIDYCMDINISYICNNKHLIRYIF